MADGYNEGYNGWANKETWLVYLWLTNEQASDSLWRGIGRELGDAYRLADVLCRELEDGASIICPSAGLYTDLLITALGRVVWDEIARHLLE